MYYIFVTSFISSGAQYPVQWPIAAVFVPTKWCGIQMQKTPPEQRG
jgi:hypothetical protein